MKTLISVDTACAGIVLRGGASVRDARAIARAWIKQTGFGDLGGGEVAHVSVAVNCGRWHNVGVIGNRHNKRL